MIAKVESYNNEVDIEEWFENTEPMIVGNQRFTMHGAIAILGVYPQAKHDPLRF